MVRPLYTHYAVLLFSYDDLLLRKATATNPMGTPFLTPQDLCQALSLAISCRDHASAQETDRSQPHLLFFDKESLQQFILFLHRKYVTSSS